MGVVLGFTAFSIVRVCVPEGNMKLAMGILVAIGAMIGIVVAFMIFDYIVILSTATIGSYMLMRGLALCIGGYAGEIEMSMARENH